LYNICLYQRKLHPISRYEQSAQLTQLKAELPVYKNVYSQVLQHVLGRVDQAFKNFLRSGFGFPRFKGAKRFDSFTYPQTGFSLGGGQLSLAKIGNVKVRLSRPLPHGAVVKTCSIKRSVNGWFATLTFEHQPVPLPANDLAVGIDVGVTTFAKFTDGTEIPNPRIYQNSQAKLRRAQRRVARRKKGSKRRRRAVRQVQKVHLRIRNRRSDFLHKHSTAVIIKYGTVKVEALNVSGMSRGNLAKQILDCSWSEWFRQLQYKAAEAGRRLVAVDPKYTSQTCSQCGFKHPDNRKTQADFACLSCGHQDNADHNAALNILARNEPLDANVSGVTLCVV
jgi:putative transposase